jgi:hypothetical protein
MEDVVNSEGLNSNIDPIFVNRVPMEKPGECGLAVIKALCDAFGVPVDFKTLRSRFGNRDFEELGAEPEEVEKMAADLFGEKNFVAKQGWTLDELKRQLSDPHSLAILNIIQDFDLYDKNTKEYLADPDGHYVVASKFLNINGADFVLILDPSKNQVVVGGRGIICLQENCYLLPKDQLEEIWKDTKNDGSMNDHWALVAKRPDKEH